MKEKSLSDQLPETGLFRSPEPTPESNVMRLPSLDDPENLNWLKRLRAEKDQTPLKDLDGEDV